MSDIFSDKEGGLEAPTRHPVNWKEDSFWDKEEFLKESTTPRSGRKQR